MTAGGSPSTSSSRAAHGPTLPGGPARGSGRRDRTVTQRPACGRLSGRRGTCRPGERRGRRTPSSTTRRARVRAARTPRTADRHHGGAGVRPPGARAGRHRPAGDARAGRGVLPRLLRAAARRAARPRRGRPRPVRGRRPGRAGARRAGHRADGRRRGLQQRWSPRTSPASGRCPSWTCRRCPTCCSTSTPAPAPSTSRRATWRRGWPPPAARPLTLAEGLALLVSDPGVLRSRACYSLLGARAGDKRVPALWVSGRRPRLGLVLRGRPAHLARHRLLRRRARPAVRARRARRLTAGRAGGPDPLPSYDPLRDAPVTGGPLRRSLFAGGGDVGAAMAERDWSGTPLGPPEAWPAAPAEHRPDRAHVPVLHVGGLGPGARRSSTTTPTAATRCRPSTRGRWAVRPRRCGRRSGTTSGRGSQSVLDTGEATWDEDLLLFLERSGYPEETYHTFSYSPLDDDEGSTAGMLCVVTETTERVIGERRMATLRDLSAALAPARTRAEVLDAAGGSSWPATSPTCRSARSTCTTTTARPASAPRRASSRTRASCPPSSVPTTPAARGCGSELRAGQSVVVDGLAERFPHLPTGAWERRSGRGRRRPPHVVGAGAGGAGRVPRRRAQPAPAATTRATAGFLDLVAHQVSAGAGQRRQLRGRAASGPRRWPSSTGRRPTSSATSATSSAPRSP